MEGNIHSLFDRDYSSLRLSNVIFAELKCVGVKRFLLFSQNDSRDLRQFCFQG